MDPTMVATMDATIELRWVYIYYKSTPIAIRKRARKKQRKKNSSDDQKKRTAAVAKKKGI
jgi:hypothetical protein